MRLFRDHTPIQTGCFFRCNAVDTRKNLLVTFWIGAVDVVVGFHAAKLAVRDDFVLR